MAFNFLFGAALIVAIFVLYVILNSIYNLFVLYVILNSIYNLFLHPLSRFPGPFWWRISRLPWSINYIRGRLPHQVLALHEKYGPVVRLAPNEVAFIDPQAWTDIYSYKRGQTEHSKAKHFYLKKGSTPDDIISETKDNHTLIRRHLALGFSDRSMRAQEGLVRDYIDLLIKGMKERCARVNPTTGVLERQPLDLRTWYNWTTFDVVGDLCFGESFGMLENASYDPWIETLNSTTQQIAFVQSMVGLGFGWLIGLLFRFIASDIETHANSTKVKIDRRRLITTDRSDLIEPLLKLHESDKLPMPKVISNAGTLLAAGSETTATLLTGVTYLLCKTPEALKKVTQEVRAAYKSEDEITLISVSKLDYMLASLDEAMRLYPPVAMGLPRTIRQGGDQVAGHFLPEGTVAAVYQWAANRSTMNFHNPLAYRPERFLSDRPAEFDRDRREAMQPFSIGPRNCVGKNLAIAEMRQILARILFSFDIELVDPNLDWLHVDYPKSFFLWDKPPMEVYLTPL